MRLTLRARRFAPIWSEARSGNPPGRESTGGTAGTGSDARGRPLHQSRLLPLRRGETGGGGGARRGGVRAARGGHRIRPRALRGAQERRPGDRDRRPPRLQVPGDCAPAGGEALAMTEPAARSYSSMPKAARRTWVVPRWLKEAFVAFAILAIAVVAASKLVQHFGGKASRAASAMDAEQLAA